MPPHGISKETGLKFTNVFPRVTDVIIPDSGSKRARYLKVLAKIDLDKPLLRGRKIKYNGQEVWVEFKYKHMATFCFYCGKVRHIERDCSGRKSAANAGVILERQYGDWMQADPQRKGSQRTDPIGPGQVSEEVDRVPTGASNAPITRDPIEQPVENKSSLGAQARLENQEELERQSSEDRTAGEGLNLGLATAGTGQQMSALF